MIKTRGVISGSKEKFHRFPLKHANIYMYMQYELAAVYYDVRTNV